MLAALVYGTGKWQSPASVPGHSLLFLGLSGLATGRELALLLPRAQGRRGLRVAPIDKLSVVLVALFARLVLGERPGPRDWLGIACVGFGALLLSLKH